ncbi:hypothetical protein [Amycolatopsis sp. NPDC051903]|uniref:hypothetical protein n=1 Tax=Amycolatopsis sp. NPDC051903 TaxID=3363936 RepID=UPI00379108F1
MFLFCLLIAYVVMRVSEDITAAVRKEPPPRQKIREAKLAARERNGGQAPQGSFGRYVSGLIDDAWDSAHHKRQLMAEHKKEKQARKATAKQERQRERWARKDAKRGGAGFDAEVPTTGEPAPAADTAGQPNPATPLGFYAQVPQPGQGPTPHPVPAPAGYSTLTPEQRGYVDGWMRATQTGEHYTLSNPQYFGLPADVRADMVAAAWAAGFAPGGLVNGEHVPISDWDREAVRKLTERGITPPRRTSVPDHVIRPLPGGGYGLADAATRQPATPEQDTESAAAGESEQDTAGESEEDTAGEQIDPVPDVEEDSQTPLPNNVIPFKRTNTTTTKKMELPVTNPEITGLESAIAYAQSWAAQCTHAHDQISAVLPDGGSDAVAASCEQAHAELANGGVTGQPLTDVSSAQEQMTTAMSELEAALAAVEAAATNWNSLATTLESHRGVQEAYNATPDAGSKEFVTAE